MKALLFQDVGKLIYDDVPDATIQQPTDAVIRVQYCGVCGSDLHVLEGREVGNDPGTVFGHELCGEVVAIGTAVRHLNVGDRVACPFSTSCGECDCCRRGLTSRCRAGQLFGWVQDGQGLAGSHSQFARVPWADGTLVKLPEGFPIEWGILLGDNLPTAAFAVEQASVGPGGTYAVLGCGTVGLLSILTCLQAGADRVFAIEGVPSRLEQALQLGAARGFTPDTAREQILEMTTGRGVDACIDAVGSPAAQRLAFELVQPGGVLSTVGVQTTSTFAFSPVEAYDKNIQFKIGRCSARHYMPVLLESWKAQTLPDLSALMTHCAPLSQGADVYEAFRQRIAGRGKTLLDPWA